MKPEIPHSEDHVSKLHAVGAMTQQKLQDIRGACEAADIMLNVPLPHNCVTKGTDLPCVLFTRTQLTPVAALVHLFVPL